MPHPMFGATPNKGKGWDHGAFDKLLHKTYKKKIDGLVKRADKEAYATLMDVVESDFGVVGADDMDDGT